MSGVRLGDSQVVLNTWGGKLLVTLSQHISTCIQVGTGGTKFLNICLNKQGLLGNSFWLRVERSEIEEIS